MSISIMNATRDPTARLRAGLNPLLTASVGGFHLQNPTNNSTPLSSVSMSSHNPFSSTLTPVSAMQPYNPQEWIASPATASDRSQQFLEPQGNASPPPAVRDVFTGMRREEREREKEQKDRMLTSAKPPPLRHRIRLRGASAPPVLLLIRRRRSA